MRWFARPLKWAAVATVLWLMMAGGKALADATNAVDAIRASGPVAVIPYQVEQPGLVSLGVYNDNGHLLRSLLVGQSVEPGEHTVAWDGLDRDGRSQPPGTYTWKLLRTPGFEATFLGSVGITIVEKPYDPWVGNSDGPSAVAWDETGWYVGSIASENIPSYRKQSPDGARRLWQKDPMEAWQGPRAMASADDTLFVLQQNAKVVAVNPQSAGHSTYADESGKRRPVAWGVLGPGDARNGSGGAASSPMDMDAWAGRFVVSYEKFDLVRWYDAKPLSIPNKTSAEALEKLSAARILREESVPQPKSVVCGANGSTYVISEGTVLVFAEDSRVLIPADPLTNPIRLAFDHQTGDLLVAEGAPSHQIKRFTRDGKLVATYGKKGGRADGPFDGDDFRDIRDLAATANGGFLVCENAVRRTALFNHKGDLIDQWLGGSPFFNFASATPENPSEIWYYAGYRNFGVIRMNMETGKQKLVASYSFDAFGGLFPTLNPFSHWRVHTRNGNTYLVHDGSAILHVDSDERRLKPLAIAGTVNKKTPPESWLQGVTAQGLDLATLSGAYTWADLNDDGDFQPDEFRFGKTATRYGGGSQSVMDSQWNLYLATGSLQTPWVCLPNLADDGTKEAPVWDWDRAEPAAAKWPPEIVAAGGVEPRGIWRDDNGAIYQFVAFNRAPNADRHGAAWPASRSGSARLVKWDADGSLAWNVGKHTHADPWWHPVPGGYSDPSRILGVVNDCVVVGDRAGWPASAWTVDGLYAGSFLDRRADDGLPERIYSYWRERRPSAEDPNRYQNPHSMHPDTPIPWDCLAGGSIMSLPTGDIFWFPQGENATPVYRVGGWDGWERQEGKLEVSAAVPHAVGTGTGLAGDYFANLDLAGEPVHSRLDSRIWFAHKADRSRWQPWSKLPVPGIGEKGFSARWAGYLEPRLSETYTFSVYVGPQDRIRLWIDGELVIDDWESAATSRRPRVTWAQSDQVTSSPVALQAGVRVPILVEYANAGPEVASLSLNWDSFTQERQRIPTACLYPTLGLPLSPQAGQAAKGE